MASGANKVSQLSSEAEAYYTFQIVGKLRY